MITTFTAIDFETAMNHHICSVGIVTFENGIIIDEYHELIQPPNNEYNWHNIRVHGITQRDTQYAPRFDEVYPEIKDRLFGNIIVAHNESFDRNVLTKTMQDYRMNYSELNIANRWECTLKIYKSKGYRPANLSACCQKHGISLTHHEALSDARACGELFLLAQKY
ncbi:MAG: 3'-5' exonuclease [Crocinitomicaceae bacterium]